MRMVLRRIKDIAPLLGRPRRLFSYMSTVRGSSLEADSLSSLLPYEPGLRKNGAVLFGHFAELHQRICGVEGSFALCAEKIRSRRPGMGPAVKIGVGRYNFFCVHSILGYVFELMGERVEDGLPGFDIFPLEKITPNFIDYINALKRIAGERGVELRLLDEGLVDILRLAQFHAQRGKVSDKQLARLLGVVAEHAFIGPQTVVVDPFHRCNVNCKHCFVHNPLIRHPEEFLERKFDLERFKNIIDGLARLRTDNVILQGDGEPLLYHNFFPMLRHAAQSGMGVSFFTNGSLLGEKEAREIIELGVREVYCSLPAGTPQGYEEVASSADGRNIFNSVVENMAGLIKLKRARGAQYPRLVMTHVIHSLNCRQILRMAEVDVRIRPDAARFYLIRLDDNNRHLKLDEANLEAVKAALPEAARIFRENGIEFIDNIKFQLGNYDEQSGAWSKDIFLKNGCLIGWYFSLIPALYDASMCCHLRTTGYLDKESFEEMWNSRRYREFRVRAKYLKENRDFRFLNGQKLYDEHCDHCDNHQTLIQCLQDLHSLGFYKYAYDS